MPIADIFYDLQSHITPSVSSKIPGFEVSIERKEGVLLTHTSRANPEADPIPSSRNFYFEISVRATGENPEYPKEEKPKISKYTVRCDDSTGYGCMGSTAYIPCGERWTRFELVESYDDGNPKAGFMGKLSPPHHYTELVGYHTDGLGKESRMSFGSRVRKSDYNEREWMMAASCPVTFM